MKFNYGWAIPATGLVILLGQHILKSSYEKQNFDNERKENFEQACDIHNYIAKTYTSLGYTTIEIPKFNVEERVNFILENLGLEQKI